MERSHSVEFELIEKKKKMTCVETFEEVFVSNSGFPSVNGKYCNQISSDKQFEIVIEDISDLDLKNAIVIRSIEKKIVYYVSSFDRTQNHCIAGTG